MIRSGDLRLTAQANTANGLMDAYLTKSMRWGFG